MTALSKQKCKSTQKPQSIPSPFLVKPSVGTGNFCDSIFSVIVPQTSLISSASADWRKLN